VEQGKDSERKKMRLHNQISIREIADKFKVDASRLHIATQNEKQSD
jgi:hypothetical protein